MTTKIKRRGGKKNLFELNFVEIIINVYIEDGRKKYCIGSHKREQE
jgi:hypothetical protein